MAEKTTKRRKRRRIVVTPEKPYYSSPELKSGFTQRLPAAKAAAQLRKGPFGKLSPRAAALDLASGGMDLFRGPQGRVGSRLARKVAAKEAGKKAGGSQNPGTKAREKRKYSNIPYGYSGWDYGEPQ